MKNIIEIRENDFYNMVIRNLFEENRKSLEKYNKEFLISYEKISKMLEDIKIEKDKGKNIIFFLYHNTPFYKETD